MLNRRLKDYKKHENSLKKVQQAQFKQKTNYDKTTKQITVSKGDLVRPFIPTKKIETRQNLSYIMKDLFVYKRHMKQKLKLWI